MNIKKGLILKQNLSIFKNIFKSNKEMNDIFDLITFKNINKNGIIPIIHFK